MKTSKIECFLIKYQTLKIMKKRTQIQTDRLLEVCKKQMNSQIKIQD